VLICSKCGAENPEGFRFCGRCAAPLAAQEPGAHELRKTVTVIFCDVADSTALGERLDPETLRKVMARYFEAMKAVIELHGGTVEKFIGDAVMAVFGVPVRHEDDALLLLTGSYSGLSSVVAVVLAVFGVVVFGALYVVMVRRAGNGPSTTVSEEQHAPAT
jgi:class 3 adenylate cyclase